MSRNAEYFVLDQAETDRLLFMMTPRTVEKRGFFSRKTQTVRSSSDEVWSLLFGLANSLEESENTAWPGAILTDLDRMLREASVDLASFAEANESRTIAEYFSGWDLLFTGTKCREAAHTLEQRGLPLDKIAEAVAMDYSPDDQPDFLEGLPEMQSQLVRWFRATPEDCYGLLHVG